MMKEFRVGYPKVFIAAIYIYNVYCSCVCTLSRLCVCSNIQKYIRLSLLFSILYYYMLKLAGVGSLLLTAGRAFPHLNIPFQSTYPCL